MTTSLPPAAIFIGGALLIAVLPLRARQALTLLLPLLGGLNLWMMADGATLAVDLFDYRLELLRVDRLSLLFGILFHIAALLAAIFALHLRDRVQQISAFVYAGGALGAVFAGDLVTLFIFWEVMAGASVFLIWAKRTPRATRAGLRYLMFHIVSGLLLLGGVLIHINETGSTTFGYLGLGTLAATLIFVAFGIKCAFPLLHTWLVDAYPESTPTGTVFLSAFSTKVAVYGLARAFPGTELLIYIGVAMTLFPIFYAVIENDLRRVLSYSMINQIGFMLAGIGIGTQLAINGAVSHAFNEVIFKGLLMMSMGAVLHRTGTIKASELGGLYKTMPATTGLCIVGAASISGFPLFSGFVSKSMILAAAAQEGHWIVWLLLLFASAGVLHHAGIKIPFFAFFAKDSGIRTREPPLNMMIAMGLAAALCVFIGSYPYVLYALLPFEVTYVPYTTTHIITQMQLLIFASLAFVALKLTELDPPELRSINIDVDWVYRRAGAYLVKAADARWSRFEAWFAGAVEKRAQAMISRMFAQPSPDRVLGRTWLTGTAVLWIAILLAAYLILSYV